MFKKIRMYIQKQNNLLLVLLSIVSIGTSVFYIILTLESNTENVSMYTKASQRFLNNHAKQQNSIHPRARNPNKLLFVSCSGFFDEK